MTTTRSRPLPLGDGEEMSLVTALVPHHSASFRGPGERDINVSEECWIVEGAPRYHGLPDVASEQGSLPPWSMMRHTTNGVSTVRTNIILRF